MSSFSRFQERNKQRVQARKDANNKFIFSKMPTTTITSGGVGENILSITACVVNKQEKDSGYIFTQQQDALPLGSVWKNDQLHWLITEEIYQVYDVQHHKYQTLLCNVIVNGARGFFKGPEKSFINLSLVKDGIAQESQEKPVLVLPKSTLMLGEKFMIEERAWMVQEYDSLSSAGVTYYSIIPTTMSKEHNQALTRNAGSTASSAPQIITEAEKHLGYQFISPNQEIVINTEDGYFDANGAVEIIEITEKEVKFKIRFGVVDLIVQYKDNGAIQEMKFKTR